MSQYRLTWETPQGPIAWELNAYDDRALEGIHDLAAGLWHLGKKPVLEKKNPTTWERVQS